MKCPYCSKEMKIGYLYNGRQPIQWIPINKKPSIFNFTIKDGVKLNNDFSMSGYSADAHYCDVCNIVISKTKK